MLYHINNNFRHTAESLSIVFGYNEANDQISTPNRLITNYIDKHNPTHCLKLTHSIAPWMKDPSTVRAQQELEEFAIKDRDTSNTEEISK